MNYDFQWELNNNIMITIAHVIWIYIIWIYNLLVITESSSIRSSKYACFILESTVEQLQAKTNNAVDAGFTCVCMHVNCSSRMI